MKRYPVEKVRISEGDVLTYRHSDNLDQTELPFLLLLHGNMSSSIHFQTLMERLEDTFRMIAPDLPGFGESTYNKEYNSLMDFAVDVEQFVKALELDTFDVLGWSTGGGIALELAFLLPEKVNTIYLLSSVGVQGYPMFKKDEHFQPIVTERLTHKDEIARDPVQVLPILDIYKNKDTEGVRAIWDNAIYINTKPEEEEYKQYLNEIIKQRNLVDIDYSLVHFNITDESNGVADGSNHIKEIKAPIVIIHGEHDLVVPIEEARKVKEAFGEQARFHEIEGAGHSIPQDNMDALVRIISNGGL